MAPDDRERNFDQALARNLRANISGGAPSPNIDCPDAEILAAYHDRLLAPEEMISGKQHIATCTRCQEILAQLEATDEIPLEPVEDDHHEFAPQSVLVASALHAPRAAIPLAYEAVPKSALAKMPRRGANWRWLAPAGALAAILLVWVAAHESRPPKFQLAKNQSAPAPVVSPAVPPLPATSAKEESASKDLQPSSTTGRAAPKANGALRRNEPAQLDQQMAPPSQNGTPMAPRRDLQSSDSLASSDSAGAQPGASAQTRGERKEPEKQQLSPLPAQPAHVATAAPSRPAFAKSAAAGVAARAAPEQSRQTSGDITNLPSGDDVSNSIVDTRKPIWPVKISAAGGTALWRAGQSGIIQHSTDAGSTWMVQASGVVADLTAGSASSNEVCWIVGRNGTIVRTADGGKHWLKASSPTTNNVTSVFAIDAQQATVSVASTNTIYKTTDGGQTWTPQP